MQRQLILVLCSVAVPAQGFLLFASSKPRRLQGWLDSLFPSPVDNDDLGTPTRVREFPEQYPATYEMSDAIVSGDTSEAKVVRPLMKNTQLESRPLRVAYNSATQGWNAQAFHKALDGKGASVVLAKAKGVSDYFGGYNPKGWSGLGGTRPSVASFLFYSTGSIGFQKLRKVGGGGLACAKDDPDTGIWLGADGLVVPLEQGAQSKRAQSKLGTYFERGPDKRNSLFGDSATVELTELKVLVGVYKAGEEIPYAGAVFDFTSG
jgi:hypothetical protein